MRNNTIQLHNVSPEEFKNQILDGIDEKLESFQENIFLKKPSEYLTRREVTSLLKISLTTLHDWCNKKILRPYRIGTSIRFKRSEIEETLQNS